MPEELPSVERIEQLAIAHAIQTAVAGQGMKVAANTLVKHSGMTRQFAQRFLSNPIYEVSRMFQKKENGGQMHADRIAAALQALEIPADSHAATLFAKYAEKFNLKITYPRTE